MRRGAATGRRALRARNARPQPGGCRGGGPALRPAHIRRARGGSSRGGLAGRSARDPCGQGRRPGRLPDSRQQCDRSGRPRGGGARLADRDQPDQQRRARRGRDRDARACGLGRGPGHARAADPRRGRSADRRRQRRCDVPGGPRGRRRVRRTSRGIGCRAATASVGSRPARASVDAPTGRGRDARPGAPGRRCPADLPDAPWRSCGDVNGGGQPGRRRSRGTSTLAAPADRAGRGDRGRRDRGRLPRVPDGHAWWDRSRERRTATSPRPCRRSASGSTAWADGSMAEHPRNATCRSR